MFEIPKPVHRPQPKGLTYYKDEFYADYYYNNPLGLTRNQFSDVCNAFFEAVSELILKGHCLHTPLGAIFILRVKHTRQYVDFGKLRNRDQHETIFRENNWHDCWEWNEDLAKPYTRKFYFEAVFSNNRAIPKYEDIRTFNIKANALQRSISQSSSGTSNR